MGIVFGFIDGSVNCSIYFFLIVFRSCEFGMSRKITPLCKVKACIFISKAVPYRMLVNIYVGMKKVMLEFNT